MNEDELTSLIAERAARGERRSDVVMSVVRRTGFAWATAEAVVDQVSTMRSRDIARCLPPLRTVISVVVLVAGLAFVVVTGLQVAELYHQFQVRRTTASAAITLFGPILETPLPWEQGFSSASCSLPGACWACGGACV